MATLLRVRRATARLVGTFSATLVAALVATACGNQALTDTTESLARDPERLKVVLRQCRANLARGDDQLCRAASEAWRWRCPDIERAPAAPASAPQSPVVPAPSATEPTPSMAGS